MSNEVQEVQPELTPTEWGAGLVNAREKLGMTVSQVATDLNLPEDYIRKLESGSLEGLPSLVFARGYIRAYAKLLHLDDGALVKSYETLHADSAQKGQIRSVTRVRQQAKMNDPAMKLFSWVFVLAIIGVSVWWWQTQYGGSGPVELLSEQSQGAQGSDEASANDAAVAVVEMVDGQATLALPQLDDGVVEESPNQSEEAAEPVATEEEPQYLSESEIAKLQAEIDNPAAASERTGDIATPAVAEAVPAATDNAATEARVSAEFVAECWVSIKDANGRTLFNNLRGKGQSINVSGKPPLSVLIGAADAVGSFTYNGSALDLAKYSRKNVVRMSLPVSE